MGGMKRKIAMEKIEKKDSRTVAFSKRRLGLYSKASDLCLLSGAKIAILATPVSSQSNVSFYSFGHSSVDSVVSAFLANQRPRDHNIESRKELGFWWEDEGLAKSENYKELSDAIHSISSMLQNLRGLQSEAMENQREHEASKKRKKDLISQEHDQNQTLKFESCLEGIVTKSEEENQIVAISDNYMNKDVVLHGTHQALNLQTCSASNCIPDDSPANQNPCYDSEAVEGRVIHRGFKEDNLQFSNLDENQIIESSDHNNSNKNASLPGNLDGYNQEHDLEYFDFLMDCEDFSKNLEGFFSTSLDMCFDSQGVQDGGAMVMHKDFDEDNLHFSDFSSMIT